jgi:DNA-directed RNA polymerase specialized sigma24 family protein
VPPRRRRAGYQPGELSAQMRDAISAEAARLDGLGDDLETIKATGQAFNALEDAILEMGEPRLRAIARLRGQGWSYNKLVAATGLSKTRVAQLVGEARARGLR